MIPFLWRISRGHLLAPWRSPYLRWRIETYWGTPAEDITFREYWRFVWQKRQDLWRYLKWVRHNRT